MPVPEVFHHDLNPHNAIGAPYMFLSYMHGNVAAELARAQGCPHNQSGSPEQNAKFRQRTAEIQIELASMEFNSIGSIYQEGDHYPVGPEMETGRGPWSDSKDYWSDWASHVYEVAKKDAETEVQEAASFALPTHFTRLIRKYGKQQQRTFAAKRYETRTGRKAVDVASWIMSDAACVVTGLRKYAQHQDWVNDAWMAAYESLLEKET